MLKVKINRQTNKTEKVTFVKSKSVRAKSLIGFDLKTSRKIITIVLNLFTFIVIPFLAICVWSCDSNHVIMTTSAFVAIFLSSFVGMLFVIKVFTNDGIIKYNVDCNDELHDYKDAIWFYAKGIWGKCVYVGLTQDYITVIFPESKDSIFETVQYTFPKFKKFSFEYDDKIVSEHDFVEPYEKLYSDIKAVKKEFVYSFDDSDGGYSISKYVEIAEKCVKPLIYKDVSDV